MILENCNTINSKVQTIDDYIEYYHQFLIPVRRGSKSPAVAEGDTWKRIFQPEELKNHNLAIKHGSLFGNGYLMAFDIDSDDYNVLEAFLDILKELGVDINTTIVRSGGEKHGFHVYFLTKQPLDFYKKTIYFDSRWITNDKDEEMMIIFDPPAKIEIIANNYTLIPPSHVVYDYEVISPPNTKFILPENLKFIDIEVIEKLLETFSQRTNESEPSKKITMEPLKTSNPKTTLKVGGGDDYKKRTLSVVFGKSMEDLSSNRKRNVFGSIRDLYGISGFRLLYSALYREVYGEDYTGELTSRINLFSPFRKERNKSFRFVIEDSGEVLSYDFRICPLLEGKQSLRIQEVFYAFLEGSKRNFNSDKIDHDIQTGKLRLKLTRQELAIFTRQIVEYINFWTRDAVKYAERINTWKEAVYPMIPDSFRKTFDFILNFAILLARSEQEDILTTQYIAENVGVGNDVANRALNILVSCGIVRKTKQKVVNSHPRPAWIVAPVVNFDLNYAIAFMNRLIEFLKPLGGLHRFKLKHAETIEAELSYDTMNTRGDNYASRCKTFKGQTQDNHLERQVFHDVFNEGDKRASSATVRYSSDHSGIRGDRTESNVRSERRCNHVSSKVSGKSNEEEQEVVIIDLSPPP